MTQEYIEIEGARENNLKNVSLKIPKRKITIFTGVSGSGKSSLVFDTIAMEAQRLLAENFSAFLRGFMPKYPQPAADSLANLNMAVVIDQKRLGGGSHSTVGTTTDLYSLLRLLFSRAGKPSIGGAHMFSFNDPKGMCPECNGLGRQMGANMELFLDESKSLNEGAILFPEYAPQTWGWNILHESRLFDMDKKIADYTKEEKDLLLYGKAQKVSLKIGARTVNITYEGVTKKFITKYIKRDVKTMSQRTQKAVERYISMGPCHLCKGARLSPEALRVKVDGRTIAELSAMEVDDLVEVIRDLEAPLAKPILRALESGLTHLCDIGLEYLSLNRETDSLSGGESARVKMVKHLTSSLVDVMYIFDEPSVGLHPRDVHRLNELLQKLRDKGNTVLVVEHDPQVIKAADYVVDLGPGAGQKGGEVVFEGPFDALLKAPTLTGRHMKHVLPIKADFRKAHGSIPIRNAKVNNLKNVSVDLPKGVLTVVTGVAGSGKSSLIPSELRPAASGGHCHRPVRRCRQFAVKPRHLHGNHGQRTQGIRESQQGCARLVQLQLEGRVRKLPGIGSRLHGPGLSGRGQAAVRGLWRQAVQGRGPGLQTERQVHHRCVGNDRSAGAGVFRSQRCARSLGGHARRRFGLSELGATSEHVVGWRMPEDKTRRGTAQNGQPLHTGRTNHGVAHV